jgi:hypothetical protein
MTGLPIVILIRFGLQAKAPFIITLLLSASHSPANVCCSSDTIPPLDITRLHDLMCMSLLKVKIQGRLRADTAVQTECHANEPGEVSLVEPTSGPLGLSAVSTSGFCSKWATGRAAAHQRSMLF